MSYLTLTGKFGTGEKFSGSFPCGLQATAAAALRLFAAGCCLALASGCASLPDVALHLDGRHSTTVELKGARGPLSAQQSASILKELERKAGTLDVLQRHVAVEEAIVGSPLVVGNKVVLLQDGPPTYGAMIAAIRKARNHINLETYIFEDDETGRLFADLLLEKQRQGIQVNLIYDSVGSLKTPKPFFERLKQAGVGVLEFNPVNPLAAKKGWQVNKRDHRKLLVIDGDTAFLGGVNISSVYSSGSTVLRGDTTDRESVSWRDTHLQVEGPVVPISRSFSLRPGTDKRENPGSQGVFSAAQASGTEWLRSAVRPTNPQASFI
jgi:cardiolipin synthase